MTLVQASIANNGKTVIILADRLLTRSFGDDFPSYEFEGNSPKIISRGDVGIGFAGSALYADMATSQLSPSISDFDEIVDNISRLIVTTHPPPTAKFIINEIISHIAMVANKTFRLMDGKHNAHTHSR